MFYSSSGWFVLPNPLELLLSIRNHACKSSCSGWFVSAEPLLFVNNHARRTVLLKPGWFISAKPTRTTSTPEESSPTDTFTRVQGGSSLAKPLEPLQHPRNHHPLTLLLKFKVVHLYRTHLNHCCTLEIMPAGHFYSSTGWFVSDEPTRTASIPE